MIHGLNSRDELNYIRTMIKLGSGADRQLEVYNREKNFNAVVDYIIAETNAGI